MPTIIFPPLNTGRIQENAGNTASSRFRLLQSNLRDGKLPKVLDWLTTRDAQIWNSIIRHVASDGEEFHEGKYATIVITVFYREAGSYILLTSLLMATRRKIHFPERRRIRGKTCRAAQLRR